MSAADLLRQLDRELVVATYTHDAGWFDTYLSDDYVLITSAGNVMRRGDVLHEIADRTLVMEPYEPTEVEVRLYGDTAIVTGRIRQRYAFDGQRVDADLRYTDTWIRSAESWVQITGHASPVSIQREQAS